MKLKFFCFLLLTSVFASQAFAQLTMYPIQKASKSNKVKSTARTQANTLTLPVWDDFSTSFNEPDTSIWVDSESVFINSGLGLQPPSINVASFDGLQSDGSPYSNNESSQGKTDSLTSCPIDLSAFSAANDIYLSFFYQFGGLGDNPEAPDSLRVEFYDQANAEWITVWPRGGAELDRSGDFVQVILPVDDDVYFTDGFQFKFQSFGRQSGPFDVWNVDYVYLNEGRSANDNSYPDRTVATPLNSIFGTYTSIPKVHFSDSVMDGSFAVTNIDIDDGFQAIDIDLTANITHYKDSAILSQFSHSITGYDESNNPSYNLGPGDFSTIDLPGFIPKSSLLADADSTFIDFKVLVNTDDDEDEEPIASVIDFRVNDSTNRTYKLKDYYSYDDGSAEIGAGLNTSGKRLAYEYTKLADTLNYLVAFDIYFPHVNTSPNGKSIDLMVWSEINTATNSSTVEYRETISISTVPGLNQFTRFELQSPVLISDSTFYIGYRQNTAAVVAIGLDKNTDTSDKMYFNVSGKWEVNETIAGSLMLRPVFGPEPTDVVGLPEPSFSELIVHPNPTSDILYIEKYSGNYEIVGIDGRTHNAPSETIGEVTKLDLSNLPQGIYLLRLIKDGNLVSKKIIKQ